MLDCLRRGQDACVQRIASLKIVGDFIRLLDDALDRLAGLRARWLADELKHLFKPLHVPFGFVAMLFESSREFFGFGSLAHLWERFKNLFLSRVGILKRLDKEVFESLGSGHGILRRLYLDVSQTLRTSIGSSLSLSARDFLVGFAPISFCVTEAAMGDLLWEAVMD
jgi:hypothetical protein